MNGSAKDIKKVIFGSISLHSNDEESHASEYAGGKCILDIPSMTYVKIEEVDQWEDAAVIFQIDELHWADGTVDEIIHCHETKGFGGKKLIEIQREIYDQTV
ncbi:MAG: hypothetical protein QNL04_08525 [SAR324 cluster bacterium]|nr:hypothetical protein [SAR324 cluster bacterium]